MPLRTLFRLLHVIAPVLAHAEAPQPSACHCELLCCHANACPVSACHCEPVRTLVWQSASPQKCLASWQLFGQTRYALRICPKYCFLFCATARRTDCHVASLLAMTSINLPRVCIIWGHCRGAAGKRPCTRAHLPVFSMSLRTTSLQPRTRPSFCMSLRTSAHTGVAIRVPAEMPGKLAAVRANSLRLTYLPKVLFSVLCYCKENGLPRRFAPRNDRGGGMSLRTTSLQPRTRPSFCMSLRTSAHTGVAIRVPAEMPGKLAAVRANSLRLMDLPGRIAFRYVLPQERRIVPSLRSSQ